MSIITTIQQNNSTATSFALAKAIEQQKRLFVIVTPDNHTATQLIQELAFFLQEKYPVLHFPDWETLPYDVFSPLPEITSERLKTLVLLPEVKHGALVVSVNTLMHKLAPREHVLARSFAIKVGDKFDIDLQRLKLESVGYQCVSQVYSHAEFAIRGAIIDIFPMGSQMPFRLELWDDEVDSIRTFDAESQLSLEKIDQIQLFPAHEFPFTDESIKYFRQAFRDYFPNTTSKNTLYADISKGITPNGIEYYLPLFVEQTATLFDYIPSSSLLVLPEAFSDYSQTFYNEAEQRYEQRKYDIERPLLKPELLFLSAAELTTTTDSFARIIFGDLALPDAASGACTPDLTINPKLPDPASVLRQFIKTFQGKILFVAESAGRREALADKLRSHQITAKTVANWHNFLKETASPCLVVAPIEHGLLQDNLVIITEAQLTGEKIEQRRRRKKSAARELENIINNLNELSIGSPVVHQEHGVGRYLGLQTLTVGGITSEFLMLEYANNDKLYVPVSMLQVISRYTGMNPEDAPLHKLGGDAWQKIKNKAIARIHDVAAELLEIHAKRAIKQGHSFVIDAEDYQAFADAFPFQETPDQQSAIEAILHDMASPQPMDRVICGDVGFGKTEVAMRAAFIAAMAGKQVAVLVPTTLLAQQHYQNFQDRFADWAVKVEVLSRFVSPKQQKQLTEQLEQGTIDIIIGTHALLSKELKYKALGLVIIDEEHRFGVRQKEHFKKLRHELDMLTLTATPIPRTLNMAMAGLRDISIIASPPPNRHTIKTFICEWVDAQIQEACLREIKRGGQVYFLHNDVKSMDKMARELGALIPEARIQAAHGQMPERELENIMRDFYHQRFNLLLCSTIIESGIDIPSANTIIINRADKLGLAQLHQLRGRVGRSHHRAYAYLIVPPKSLMSKDAQKRLEAVETSGELGAGFMLSSHDMEIRGAGELLGDEQSGQIQEIGFTLYSDLLERAVNALKSGKQPELNAPMNKGVEVELQAAALIPEDYLPDVHLRLVLYKRIANTETAADLRELQIEMIDRFGLLPEPVKTLFSVTELKQQAEQLGIKKIEANATGGRLIFTAEPNINTEQLINLIQTQAAVYRLDGMDKLRFTKNFSEVEQKVAFIAALLVKLNCT
jgi:transcription-repair coupling factor (superfamily II helicase)